MSMSKVAILLRSGPEWNEVIDVYPGDKEGQKRAADEARKLNDQWRTGSVLDQMSVCVVVVKRVR